MFDSLKSHLLHWSLDFAGAVWVDRFRASLADAPDLNEALLARILEENRDTVYGQRHRFGAIHDPAEYARRVPLTDFESYRDLVDRIADGEQNVLTREPVKYLGVTSGTTGRGKLVPVTKSAQSAIIAHMMLTPAGVLAQRFPAREAGPAVLMLSSTLPQVSKGGIPIGTATAAGMDRMKGVAELFWSSPLPVTRVRHQPLAVHLHVLYALARRNLAGLTAPFLSSVLDFFQTLEADWPLLCDELERGRVAKHPELDEALSAQLSLRPDRARAAEVRAACEAGLEGIARRLWPNLKMIVGVMGGSFRVYEPATRRYLGGLPIHSPIYACTEALLGVSLEPESTRYALVPESCYFELIPLEEAEADEPSTLTLRQAEVGGAYELVLTTRSGLYRYRLGDVVRVVGRQGRAPVVEFSHRRGQLLDVASEKTSERAMGEAVLETARQLGVELLDFSTRADLESRPNRYEVFVELTPEAPQSARRDAQRILDEALGAENPGYAILRRSQRLGPPALHLVRRGTFAEVRALLVAQGASPAQVKVPRVLAREDLRELVRARVTATLD